MQLHTTSLPLRILTHNIRYAAPNRAKGEDPWPIRRPRVTAELRFNTINFSNSFICLQEVLHSQLLDIYHDLNAHRTDTDLHRDSSVAQEPTWAYIGVGRDDGKQAGEYSPIFYRPAVWSLLSYNTIWLSETPDRPSKGWDAASIRILTIGKFRHRETSKVVVAMNTHLDDQGAVSRQKSAVMILEQVEVCSKREEGEAGNGARVPVFLAGDFNSTPDDGAYRTITTAERSPLVDVRTLVPERERYGHECTFSGFDDWDKGEMTRLDYLFLNYRQKSRKGEKNEAEVGLWVVKSYGVLENRFEDRVYLSDHRAVVSDVVLLWPGKGDGKDTAVGI